jgi:hypothetical protein
LGAVTTARARGYSLVGRAVDRLALGERKTRVGIGV